MFLHKLIPYSLKYRLLIVLVLSTMIPLTLIGAISYYSIFSIQKNKVQGGIQSSLNQLDIEFENCMKNLNYTSQQLSFEGDVVDDIQSLIASNSPYQTALMTQKIRDMLNLISYTNLQLGLMFYYSPDSTNKISFENSNVRPDFDFSKLPVLYQQMGATYYGPHKTLNKYNSNMVFSILRQVTIPDRKIFIYIETDYKWFENMLKNANYGIRVVHFITNSKGKVVFSENDTEIPVGSYYDGQSILKNRADNAYYIFKSSGKTEFGWHVLAAVDMEDFNHENHNWMEQYVLLGLLSVCISIFFAFVIWRTIYSPIRIFNREILLIENSEFDSPLKTASNKEFDQLFIRFRQMAINIKKLIRTVEQKERLKSSIEAEKLRYKINPHFLHNTLDTVRWLARSNGQGDIDRLVSSLNRVLHYNLGKMGEITTIGEEIEILEEYVSIQKTKYDFEFDTVIQADERIRKIPVPRFILQPLVENALQHGLKDNMLVKVEVRPGTDGFVIIRVSDNGKGMSEEMISSLLDDTAGRSRVPGLGIGLNYVRSVIRVHYGDEAKLDIYSVPGEGTDVTLVLPDRLPDESSPCTEGQGL